MKALLTVILTSLLSCTIPSCQTTPETKTGIKDLSIGNCNGQKGIFIPLERYGNFTASGQMGCSQGKVYLRIMFNGVVLSYVPVKDKDGNVQVCVNKVKGEI